MDKINSPADLRGLSVKKLRMVCDELREYIIDVIEEKGGHFASPLGVVDLTVALHSVFDTPRDLLIWDVSHQCYAHKIITGRRDQFPTLRQDNGISGFCRREESEYDAFGAGHASTSISAALGMARARDLKGETHKIIAVVGDGGLTGGLAYEGINNVGILDSQLLIVLNDNRMSISPTVGALSHYLTKVVTNPLYNRVRDRIWELTGKLPKGSTALRRLLHSLQEGLKTFLVPGMIFEELGIRYFGPIDGHDMDEMIDTLEKLKDFPRPSVVHLLTRKGSGKKQAEEDPLKWYSVAGRTNTKKPEGEAPDYYKAFGQIACQLAEQDEDICCVVAAMREGTGLVDFARKFPQRFFDCGIAEGHAVTFSGGLAVSGIKPITAIYSTFLQRSFDMLVHDIAIQGLHVVFVLDRSGVVGPDGPTHHGSFDLSYLQLIPGMTLAAPKDGDELRDLLYTGLYECGGPFAVRYPKASSLVFHEKAAPKAIPIGSWEIIAEGESLAILAVGSMVEQAKNALPMLPESTLKPRIVNARFIKPLDDLMLREIVSSFEAVLTIEEGTLVGGFGSAVLGWLNEHGYGGTVYQLGIPDEFIDHGSRKTLLDNLGLTANRISDTIARIGSGKEVQIL
ncbi:MAG: 1-deoxy-D-xylulose-5-phosphate synthase [Candidatus Neomarinimicrobiota bacterium]